MTGLEKEVLQDGLCEGCGSNTINAKLSYEVDAEAKTVTVTDESTFIGGDDLKVVNVSVYDKDGNEKHGQITADGGNVSIDVSTLNLNKIDIKATVVSTKGNKVDLGIYDIGNTALSGNLDHEASQGNRNLN